MQKRTFTTPVGKARTSTSNDTNLDNVVLPGVLEVFERASASDNEGRLLTVFLSTEKDPSLRESFRNRATAWRQGSPIIHCETYFPATRDSFVVTANEAAHWEPRRTMQRDWIVLSHELTPRQLTRARELFSEHEGRAFDDCGWACGLFCMSPAFTSEGSTMCSRVVAEVYSHPDVAILREHEIDYRIATPAELYEILKPPRSKPWVLPVKMDRFAQEGGLGL